MTQDLTIMIVSKDAVQVEHRLTYLNGHDKTIIWENIYARTTDGSARLELASERIVGWYYGEPDVEAYNKVQLDNLKAEYEV